MPLWAEIHCRPGDVGQAAQALADDLGPINMQIDAVNDVIRAEGHPASTVRMVLGRRGLHAYVSAGIAPPLEDRIGRGAASSEEH
jgi:hypothetical protein